MTASFRLIEATSNRVAKSQRFSDVRVGDLLPPVEAKFWHDGYLSLGNDCAYSVVIGSNGTGKSRLFGGIADDLMRIDRSRGAWQAGSTSLDALVYDADGRRLDAMSPGLYKNSNNPVPLPSKVIAVALTPFDKFPLELRSRVSYNGEYEHIDHIDNEIFYHYVGMRDRTNRASITALLYRAIEGLSRSNRQQSPARLRKVFELLGYDPPVRVILRADITKAMRATSAITGDLFDGLKADTLLSRRIRTAIVAGVYREQDIQGAIQYASSLRDSRGYIEVDLDFSDMTTGNAFDMRPIRLLRSLGLIRLAAVQVKRIKGAQVDLQSASSGEISIFTAFLSIASFIENGSLVLIDEPETGLHPEWQSKYVHLMTEVFKTFSGCHFVLSTHSPLIISDLPKDSFVYSLDRRSAVDAVDVVGRSPDFVMANAFDVVGSTNYYLKDVLTRAIRLASDGLAASDEFESEITELRRLSEHMLDGGQVRRVLDDLERARNLISRKN